MAMKNLPLHHSETAVFILTAFRGKVKDLIDHFGDVPALFHLSIYLSALDGTAAA